MRNYTPKKSDTWRIDPDRYHELRAFCRQYPKWLAEAKSALELSSPKLDGMPRGTDTSDPTERAVEQRDRVLAKIELVDRCAMATEGGRWRKALILNVCNGMTYEVMRDLHPDALRNSNRTAYFAARRKFFAILDREKA